MKRHYRKVAVIEEFFDIIYNVHMELGGRSGSHAGQKRTYRIVSLQRLLQFPDNELKNLFTDFRNICLSAA